MDPKWAYPQSKVATEKVIHAERGKIPAVILRIAGMYDDLCNSTPLAQQIQRIYEHDITAYLFPGEVSAGRQAFVHNDDLIDSILLAVARRKELSTEVTLLIGEPESLSYDELQSVLGLLIHGLKWKTRAIPPAVAKLGAWLQEILPLGRPSLIKPWMVDFADDNFELDITRARTILGWEPKHSLRDTLPKMIPSILADPLAWYHENELKPPLWLRELAPSVDQTKEMEPHELMRLGEEVQHAIKMSAPMVMPEPAEHRKGSEHAKHDMTKMEASKAGDHPSMAMNMSGSDQDNARVRAIESQLEQMRGQQAQLAQAYQREMDAQKKEDASAHALMEQDPRGHIAMMKMEQERRQLALELPRLLLQKEAQVYQELQSAQDAAQAKMPETGKMMLEMVAMAPWSQIPLLVLGPWLIVSPFSLGYRSASSIWSDVISGILITALAVIAFRTKRVWPAWANAFVGLWLAFAPLAFWAPDPVAYGNDTLVGMLVIVFAMIIPMMMDMPGPEVPLGWSYNPASWQQRAPILALALVSFFLAQYMAAFQLGYIHWAWDPIFGDGTVRVIGSDLSKSFPISDAGLGAFVYLIELLSGFMGDPAAGARCRGWWCRLASSVLC